jgi:hypothetical protein
MVNVSLGDRVTGTDISQKEGSGSGQITAAVLY